MPRNALPTLLVCAALVGVTTAAAFGHGLGGQDAASSLSSSTSDAATEPEANGTLVVVVDAVGGDAGFLLHASGGGLPANFTLATENGTARAAFNVTANETLALSEDVPAGWKLSAAWCDEGEPGNLTVPPNGTRTCVFRNVKLATLVVEKTALGGEGTFRFLATGPGLPAAFNLTTTNGTGRVAFGGLDPEANYTLAEDVPAGWNQTLASCPGNLTLPAGGERVCAFENARLNTLVVRVDALGGDALFPFNATGGGGLPEAFNLTTANGTAVRVFADLETNRTYGLAPEVPAGWKLASSWCDAGTPDNVTLAHGQTVTCVFNQTKLGAIHLQVVAHGGDVSLHLATSGGAPLPASLPVSTVNGTWNATFEGADPHAAYAVSAAPPAGWRVVSSSCTHGTPAGFHPPPGGEVACVLGVSRLVEFRGVVWLDADRNGTRDAGEPGLAGWTVWLDADGDGILDANETLALTDAEGRYGFAGLAPGEHLVRLLVPAGWTPTAPATAHHRVALADGAWVEGVDFGVAAPSAPTPPPEPPAPPARQETRGPGFWKNWDAHGAHNRSVLDAWVSAVAAASAWLMPEGYAADADGMRQLLEDSTKQCNRKLGHEGCARAKFEARYLVLRLNVESGRLAPDATVHLSPDAASLLGLGATATVRQLVDAFEARAGTELAREDYLRMKDAAASAVGEG